MHPPDAALPRALRLQGRRVSRCRGCRRALARAAILPRYDGRSDRDRVRGARRSARRERLDLSMPAHGDTLVATAAEIESLTALREATGEVDGTMERHTLRCFLL